MPARVALVTAERLPDGSADAQGLMETLSAKGLRPEMAVWTDRSVSWDRYDVALLHTPWDYSTQLEAFLQWVTECARATTFVNDPRLIPWNARKFYLRDLASAGVCVPRTVWLLRGAPISPAALGTEVGDGPLVVKPVVGAGGRIMARVETPEAIVETRFSDGGRATCDLLVQEFEPSVVTDGELSVIVLDGLIRYGVRKIPRAGEYRCQPQHGGTLELVDIRDHVRDFVTQVMAALPRPASYARVDICRCAQPALMEVEVIEPDLFLRLAGAFDLMAELVLARLASLRAWEAGSWGPLS